MKTIKLFFCITLVIFGFLIFEIAFRITTPGIQLHNNWHFVVKALVYALFVIGIYGIANRKLVCQLICRQFKNSKEESAPPYRIEQYVLRRWQDQDIVKEQTPSFDLVNIQGRRSRYSDDVRIQAIKKWEMIKQHPNGVTLEEFLEAEFGIANGVLNVSRSSFYTWRRKFKDYIEG